MRIGTLVLVSTIATACAAQRPFPLREPMRVDTDLQPVSVACRPDPSPKEPDRKTCAPVEYVSPFVWDQVDKLLFEPLSRVLSLEDWGEASNANSLDEVADSAWFINRVGSNAVPRERLVTGACAPEDMLPAPDEVPDGGWVIDHGKDNGSTLGFRVVVPGKGLYLLKADDEGKPERASAASVIGASIYHAIGFNTSCEQVVVIRKAQLALTPGLKAIGNDGVAKDVDEAWLDNVLATTTQVPGHRVRMQASKWLPGLPVGPFRYLGTRADDPNDVIDHEQRRELRGGRLLAAWLNHWDAREQNSMDVWLASNPKDTRSSPGYVRHYILDISEILGGEAGGDPLTVRLSYTYLVDLRIMVADFVTLGMLVHPWDRAEIVKGHEQFHYFTARDFDPEGWKTLYPNPAFTRMTERDGAWMARLIARFSPDDVRAAVSGGQFRDPSASAYVTRLLVERQHALLARYLFRLSPLGDVRVTDVGAICATDFARLRGAFAGAQFRYEISERRGGTRVALPAKVGPDGELCFQPSHGAARGLPDSDPRRIVVFEVRNGTTAGPLEIHTYDLDDRGTRLVGLVRAEP